MVNIFIQSILFCRSDQIALFLFSERENTNETPHQPETQMNSLHVQNIVTKCG